MKSTFKWTLLALSIPALIACGGGGGSDSDDKTPAVKANSHAIIAARSNAKVGDRVRLDGTNSLVNADTMLNYAWSITEKPQGSTAELNNVTSVAPYFTADVAGNYSVQLTTTAGDSKQTTSYNINISDAATNVPPSVKLDLPSKLALDQTITLEANAYDADGDILSYQWAITSTPDDAAVKLTGGANSVAEFHANTAGEYQLQLTVNDGYEATVTDFSLHYTAGNVAPVANAGDAQTFELGTEAHLDGSASFDGNNDALTYNWKFISKPENSSAQLSSSTEAKPSFTPDLVGDYVVALTVSDGEFTNLVDHVRVTATEVGTSDLVIGYGSEQTAKGWPFTEQFTVNQTLEGNAPEYVLIETFTLEAVGQDYQISETTALDYLGLVQAQMTGIEVGQTLHAGDKVTVKMFAQPTAGQMSMISFGFMLNNQPDMYMGLGYLFTTN